MSEVLDAEGSPESGLLLTLASPWDDVAVGESIAVDGVCLTALEALAPVEGVPEVERKKALRFFLSSETLERTALKLINKGKKLNVERALTLQSRLSGHWLQGHIDGVAKVVALESRGDAHRLILQVDPRLSRYLVAKGSIGVNGVSLTVNACEADQVDLMVIPHTWKLTNLSRLRPDDSVNIEVDLIAKYVEKLCRPYIGR